MNAIIVIPFTRPPLHRFLLLVPTDPLRIYTQSIIPAACTSREAIEAARRLLNPPESYVAGPLDEVTP